MRHWEPRIAGAVDTALELGHDALVGLVLAPHWSSLSIAKYERLFDDAVAGRVETRFVRAWGTEPGFVCAARGPLPGSSPRRLHGPLAPGPHPRDR